MAIIAGKEVGPIGFGMAQLYLSSTPLSSSQRTALLKKALSLGANCWNGSEFYGPPEANSLVVLASYLAEYPEDAEKLVINIKGALPNYQPDCSEAGIRRSVEACLKQLGATGHGRAIDVFECARMDKNVSVEETMSSLKALVDEGKIKAVGLSEVKAETIRRAAKIVPIASVEVEVSLWATDVFRNGVAEACAQLNIPILAYSPLGKGMLTGAFQSQDDIPEKDFRRLFPRFLGEAFESNVKLVREIQQLAKRKGCTAAQIAIGWLLAISGKDGNPVLIPIPGTSSEARLVENMQPAALTLEDLEEIDKILGSHEIVGGRYGGRFAEHIEG